MAFRIGKHVADMAERLCSPVENSKSWTYILSDTTEGEARSTLDIFNKANVSKTMETIY